MIYEYPIEKRAELLPLFEKHGYLQLIAESLLKEKLGTAHVNDLQKPTVALLVREIIVFVTGDEKDPSVPELLELVPPGRLIFVPNEGLIKKIKEFWGGKLTAYPRTKFSSDGLDRQHMQEIMKKLPEGLAIRKLTKETIQNISEQAKRIIGILFPSVENFIERNFGFAIFDGEKIASLALAATPIYGKDFEIHIETDPDYQRKGLASIICAKLVDYSLEQGLVPHWDADNEPSAGLALKLGYTKPEKYNAYYWMEKK